MTVIFMTDGVSIPPVMPLILSPETRVVLCGSQNHHKIFHICQACDRICDCHKFCANLHFGEDQKPPFAGISHFSPPQILILHRICGDQKSNCKLDICRRLCEGFVSCTKGPLFPVCSLQAQLAYFSHSYYLYVSMLCIYNIDALGQ